MPNYITFGGVTSTSVGVTVEVYPSLNRPQRKIEKYSIPGRNGDIVMVQDAWENYEQEYEIWAGSRSFGASPSAFVSVADWLFSGSGYQRLEDTYEPNYYRMACFVGPFDVDNVLSQFGRATITFDCMPQRFLKSGETAVMLTASGTMSNPTSFTALPVITVHGSGSGVITCGYKALTISSITDGMVIDSVNQDAYYSATNLNNVISGNYPVIPGGNHIMAISGGITSIEVVPNWWTL